MNIRGVLRLIALMLLMLALFMLLSTFLGWAYGDDPQATRGMFLSALLTVGLGAVLLLRTNTTVELSRRDGFLVVVLGWLMCGLLGALPYYLGGIIPDYTGALFETMSGLTTTGASVMSRLEEMPRGILFWRSVTHLLGGMGVLVLCVAILPFLGVGGMQIYRAEMPGPSKDRLTPRIATTAKLLWGTYVILIAALMLLLRLGGMDWFDAVCHAFATVATGGFSTRSESIAAFNSVYIESVIMFFMFLAGVNFALHYRALTGRPGSYFKNPEFRFFASLMLVVTLYVSLTLWGRGTAPTFPAALRQSAFQVLSIATTTGFATENFAAWPREVVAVLLLLMIVGACGGSTAGGIKNLRVMITLKKTLREIRVFLNPKAVISIKIGKEPVALDVVSNVTAFVMVYILAFVAGLMVMLYYAGDFATAVSSVLATLGCIGPGLGAVGPLENYADYSSAAKATLILFMLLGRLELYSVLVLFLPTFWKK